MFSRLNSMILTTIFMLCAMQQAAAWTHYIGVKVINNNHLFEYDKSRNLDEGGRFVQTMNDYRKRLELGKACDPRTLAAKPYNPKNKTHLRRCNSSSRPAPTNKQFVTKWVPEKLDFKDGFVSGKDWNKRKVRLGLFREEKGGWKQSLGYQCRWTIDGVTIGGLQPCRHFETELTLGGHVASVVIFKKGEEILTTKDLNFEIDDFLLVAMGDSFGSGEGNPHTYAVAQKDVDSGRLKHPKPAMWWDSRCHRSLFSSSGLTTALLADSNRHKSFSLISTACSGAETTFGLTKDYRGKLSAEQNATLWTRYTNNQIPRRYEESFFGFDAGYRGKQPRNSKTKPARRDIPAQIDQLAKFLDCDGLPCRKPDALLLYMGVNDIGFSDLVIDLILNCESDNKCIEENEKQIAAGLSQISKSLKDFGKKLKNAGLYPEQDSQIYLVGYPNPMTRKGSRKGKLLYCDDRKIFKDGDNNTIVFGSGILKVGVSTNGAKWAQEKILSPLNNTLKELEAELGWTFIETENSMLGHGYCSDKRYFNTYWDADNKQGKTPSDFYVNNALCNRPDASRSDCEGKKSSAVPSGTMHPNYFGHRAVSALITNQLRQDFNLK